jgi:hypothetical protein
MDVIQNIEPLEVDHLKRMFAWKLLIKKDTEAAGVVYQINFILAPVGSSHCTNTNAGRRHFSLPVSNIGKRLAIDGAFRDIRPIVDMVEAIGCTGIGWRRKGTKEIHWKSHPAQPQLLSDI